MLKNYTYFSTAKIDMLWPQLPPDFFKGAKAKTTIDLGLLKTEVEATQNDPSNEEKIREIVSYLEKEGEVGTIEAPKRFFKGEFRAKSIVYGNGIFFSGADEKSNKYVGLTGSLKHMLGYQYHKYVDQSANSLGDSEYYRGGSSASIGFSRALRNLWAKDESFYEADLKYEVERQRRLEEHKLTPEQVDAIQAKQWSNKLVIFSSGPIAGFLAPAVKLMIGPSLYSKKSHALQRQDFLNRCEPAPEKVLESEDQDLLHSVKNVGRQIDAPKRNYVFFAITLLEGTSHDDRVVLGSPLW